LRNPAIEKDYHDLLAAYREETKALFKSKGASFVDMLPEPKVRGDGAP
jgi:hypothetical protein